MIVQLEITPFILSPLRLFLSLALYLFSILALSGQEIELAGKILDSLGQPLPHTNIIAKPISGEKQSLRFAISSENGKYKLALKKEVVYRLEISHLGFFKGIDTVVNVNNAEKDYILYETVEALEEIIIEQQMAVIVKKDTITYRVDQFNTGEERKLREVLQGLPGVEVDREGNVTVNGKKVTKLMVEGKTFFTGDTKLGVNNIPADAVAEVVALDNYSEVAFLKDLNDSDRMALNIKLKEGKKKFTFGDIEAGAGFKDRYLLHPTLFYYSPRTAVNVIGDFNNIGEKSFTMQDYINFEGGYDNLMEGYNSFSNVYYSDFARFLGQLDFIHSRNKFGAGSISQEVSSSLQLDAYTIASGGNVETRVTNDITYLTEDRVDEFRETTTENNLFFTLSKLGIRYQPSTRKDLSYETLFKTSSGKASKEILSRNSNFSQMRFREDPRNIDISQSLIYNRQFSYKHITTIKADHQYYESSNLNNWFFDRPVFSEIIPFEDEAGMYNLLHNTSSKSQVAQIDFKHYWVLNNLNHIYPTAGVNLVHDGYKTQDYQQLPRGDINSFRDSGFDNDLNFYLLDIYAGMDYKMKRGDLIVKPGLRFHFLHWQVDQFEVEMANRKKTMFLPRLMMKYEFGTSENLTFNYEVKSNFTGASSFANRLRLVSFNRLFQGNIDLQNELSHSLSLRYFKFNMYRGVFLNGTLNYTRRINSIRSTTTIEGIDQVSTIAYTDVPENTYFVTASVSKKIKKVKFTLSGNANFSDYSRIFNNRSVHNQSRSYNYETNMETSFRRFPNVEVGLEQNFHNFISDDFNNYFTEISPYFNLDYDFLNDFILNAEYSYNFYNNEGNNEGNQYQIGNASLFYNKENNPWSLELSVQNIFDVSYKNSNSFSEFLITDQRIYIQPRTTMFKIGYKF